MITLYKTRRGENMKYFDKIPRIEGQDPKDTKRYKRVEKKEYYDDRGDTRS